MRAKVFRVEMQVSLLMTVDEKALKHNHLAYLSEIRAVQELAKEYLGKQPLPRGCVIDDEDIEVTVRELKPVTIPPA